MSIKRDTDKIVVYSQNKILFSNKKDQTTNPCNHIDGSQQHYIEQYIKFRNRQNQSVGIKSE